MSTPPERLSPNEEEVAAKVIDGEAILINLSNGIYYSLDGVGTFVWELITHGHSVEEIIEATSEHYGVSAETAKADIEKLIEEMRQEKLVKSNSSGKSAKEVNIEVKSALAYAAPTLNIYRDMGDLLALDPPMPGLADMAWKEPEEDST